MTFKTLAVGSLAVTLLFPFVASAHEHDTFLIGGRSYQFVVGSLGEPTVVDAQSGVDLHVFDANGKPLDGLEKTLQVELQTDNKRKTLSFDPSDESPGAYSAAYIPTVETGLTYRIFGTLNGVEVSLPFHCVSGEFSEAAEDKTLLVLSSKVSRTEKVGAFGCPISKGEIEFPEIVPSNEALNANQQALEGRLTADEAHLKSDRVNGIAGLALAALALATVGGAFCRNKK